MADGAVHAAPRVRSVAVSNCHGRMFVSGAALCLRCISVRCRLVVIAFLMLGDGLKMVVGGSDVARGGEMVLVACNLDLGVGHDLFLWVG